MVRYCNETTNTNAREWCGQIGLTNDNTDLCEACYETFQSGTLRHRNSVNPVSMKVEDHSFAAYADPSGKQFRGLQLGPKTPKANPGATKTKKVKPNAKCPCGSKKKYKKCCMD